MKQSSKPFRPKSINILGRNYTVSYFKKIAEVDQHGHQSLHGQIQFTNGNISIHDCKDDGQRFQTIMHEVIHGVLSQLGHNEVSENEDFVDILAVGLGDTLWRNGWIK